VLDGARIKHAFGGALALAYYAEPRGTLDVDVNVFLPLDRTGPVLALLEESIGFVPETPAAKSTPAAGIRLRRTGEVAPVDVFFSLDPRYDAIARRRRRFPFGTEGRRLPFLSAEDLTIFKLSFGRDKDWVDLRRLVEARPGIDLAYIEDQLIGLRGPTMYPRLARLRTMIRQARPPDS
jgi:hypothetical protein